MTNPRQDSRALSDRFDLSIKVLPELNLHSVRPQWQIKCKGVPDHFYLTCSKRQELGADYSEWAHRDERDSFI